MHEQLQLQPSPREEVESGDTQGEGESDTAGPEVDFELLGTYVIL